MPDFPANGFRIFKSTDGATQFHLLINNSVYPLVVTDEIENMESGYYDEELKPIELKNTD